MKEVDLKLPELSKCSLSMIEETGVIEMTTEESVEKKPALYWITLAIMFAAFFAVVLA